MEHLDKTEFINLVNKSIENIKAREAVFNLLEFSQKYALKVTGGEYNRSFHHITSTSYGSDELFHCDFTGNVWLEFDNFTELNSDIVAQFTHKLVNLSATGFMYLLPIESNYYQGNKRGFCIEDTLVNPKIMREFKAGILKLQNDIRKKPQNKSGCDWI